MASIYKFDLSTVPFTMYEWDDGIWKLESLSLNETLMLNGDNTISLLKTHTTYNEIKTFAFTVSELDEADVYYRVSETYTLPDGTPVSSGENGSGVRAGR